MAEKKMSLKEFKEKHCAKSKDWDWEKFRIVCQKCGSNKIEFNGELEDENGYYDEHYITGNVIVKCHDCGNAHSMEFSDLEKN